MDVERVDGLGRLAERYDAVLCDVWGVVHNGVTAFPQAVEALRRFRLTGGRVVLVTNAPRPADPVIRQLLRLGVGRDAFDAVVTSGDVTRGLIAREGVGILHVGPERDMSIYDGLPIRLVGEAEAEVASCTGLKDDRVEAPDDYRPLLARLAARRVPMICANPDIVVDRGGELVWCAGALARLYEEMGGEVTRAGKPFRPIYEAALQAAGNPERSRVLAIGDGLPTDVRGASDFGLDLLFVTAGIHAADFGPPEAPDATDVAARLAREGLRAVAFVPHLVWDASDS